jgi:hypothetical protein
MIHTVAAARVCKFAGKLTHFGKLISWDFNGLAVGKLKFARSLPQTSCARISVIRSITYRLQEVFPPKAYPSGIGGAHSHRTCAPPSIPALQSGPAPRRTGGGGVPRKSSAATLATMTHRWRTPWLKRL